MRLARAVLASCQKGVAHTACCSIRHRYRLRAYVRPLSERPVYRALKKVRSCRHFARHDYRHEFDDARVEENEARAEEVVITFITDIDRCSAEMSVPI